MAAESNIGWKVYDRRIRRSRTRPNKTLPFHECYDHRPATRSPTRFLLPPPLFTATRRLPIIQSIIQFPFLSSGEIVRLPVRGTSMYSWGIWEKCIFTSGNFGLFHIFPLDNSWPFHIFVQEVIGIRLIKWR